MPVNDDVANALIRHQVELQRLSASTVRKILRTLSAVERRLLERLATVDITEFNRTRQRELLRSVKQIIDSVYEDATGQLRLELEDLAEYEIEFQETMFEKTVPVRFDMNRVSRDQVWAAVNSRPFNGRVLKDWFSELEEGAFRRLRSEIQMGFIEGRTTEQLIRDIRGTKAENYRNGVLAIGRRGAEATVRTAINHTANAARNRLYQRNTSLIKGVQWVSTLDGRTSAICRARDGNVYDVDKGPRPPAHPNCRSSTVPVLKSWRELGLKGLPKSTRASMNGQVAEDLTYSDWLRTQDQAFQEEVLGIRKAKLFREGGIDLDKFVTRSGDELTLDELRRKEREAWKKVFG